MLLLVFMGGLLALLFVYEDEVKAAIISELNRHLKAEVKIDPKNIDLTIIKTFPDCSVEFKDALMLEALNIKQRDTLLFAGRLNLHFNMKDLWNKHYRIHKIALHDGVIKLRVLGNGQVNYIFWDQAQSKNNSTADPMAFELKLLSLERCRVSYKDKQHFFKTDGIVENLQLNGNFHLSEFSLQSQGKLQIHSLASKDHQFLKNKHLDFELAMDVRQNRYTISKASLNLNRLLLDVSGSFVYADSLADVTLNYKAPALDIASLLSLLPAGVKSNVSDYQSSGNFYARGKFRFASSKNFALTSDFGIAKGAITYKPQGTTARNLHLDGRLEYSNSASLLSLKNISLALNNDAVNGSCSISNFSDPLLNLSVQAGLHLENLQAFFPIDTLSSLKGNLKIHSSINGRWRDLKSQAFSDKVQLELDAWVSGLEARFKGDDRTVSVENCSLTAVGREIEVKELKLKRGSSDILLNGKLPGIFNYLSDNKNPQVITGNLFSNYIRLEDFMVKYRSSGGEGPLIQPNIRFKLNAAILKFTYAKFEARSVTGEIEIHNQKAMVSDMHLEAMDGEATIDAFADNSRNRLEVTLQSRLKNINISQLFAQFNNFGQATLQDKHLKGFASAEIDLAGNWSNKLEADYPSIHANCNLGIERGELVDFKPLLSLSRFVDIQDLQRIRFATLKSNIRIENKTISFPKTELKNSALNLSLWGSHTFNNEIDYHLQLLISELLAKKRKNNNDEFGPVEHDTENRRSAFILMTGTVDNPIIKYDRRGLKEKIKADMKEEKKDIKRVLKEEFGLFKKDTAVKKSGKAAPVFELEKPAGTAPKKTLEPKKKEEDDEDF